MTYNPDPNKLVAVRILEYLTTTSEAHRAFGIADEIDSKTDYTRKVCNQLHREGWLQKFQGGHVIGHPMPDGKTEVLSNSRQKLLNIVKRYAPSRLGEAKSKPTVEKLREFIENEIAIGPGHPLGTRKVYFGVHAEVDATERSLSIVEIFDTDKGPDANATESSDTPANAD